MTIDALQQRVVELELQRLDQTMRIEHLEHQIAELAKRVRE